MTPLIRKTISRMGAVLLVLALLFSLCACGDDSADAVVRFEVDKLPTTFDPQLAQSYSELLTVRNLYEGLFRTDNDGNLVKALASSYTISSDQLTYTFHLREDAQWKDETPLTADDFVFGFRRAADPITEAPFADTISCIKNVTEALDGLVPVSQIGVSAPDKHTLVIELEYANPLFLNILTSAVAMPCNEAFFEAAGGQYGLTAEKTLTNGSFKLYSWQDSLVRMNRSSTYVGDYTAKCAAVIVSTAESGSTNRRIDRIAAGSIDVGIITDDEYETAQEKGISVTSFEDISYVLIINPKASIGTPALAKVWAHSFDRQNFEDGLHDYLTTASSLIPSALTLLDQNYRDVSNVSYDFSYTPSESKEALLSAVKTLSGEKLPSVTLLYPDTLGVKDIAAAIAQDWQQNLGAYVNISAQTTSEIKSTLSAGSYQMAIVPVSSADNTVVSFLENFVSDSSSNIYGFSNAEYDQVMRSLVENQYNSSADELAVQAESILAQSCSVIPLAFGHTRYAVSSAVKSIRISLTGGAVDFAFTVRKS